MKVAKLRKYRDAFRTGAVSQVPEGRRTQAQTARKIAVLFHASELSGVACCEH